MSSRTQQGPRPPVNEPELMEKDVSSTVDAANIIAISKAEIDQQIATAKTFPRSVTQFITEATELVCLNEEVATSCIYSLPRGKNDNGTKKFITGPSARFAELIAYSFRNNLSGGRVVNEGPQFITAQGAYHDLEKNTKVVIEVQRRITDSRGRRYNEDMIGVTGNAAIAIAHRNACLKGVPKPLWLQVYERARGASIGDVTTLNDRRAKAIEWFQKVGVDLDTILAALNVKGVEDIGLDQLETLAGLRSAIKDRALTPEQAFAPAVTPDGEPTGVSGLGDRIKAARKAKAPTAPEPEQAPDGGPAVDIEGIRKRLNLAADKDALDEAGDEIRLVAEGPERTSLQDLYEQRALDLL